MFRIIHSFAIGALISSESEVQIEAHSHSTVTVPSSPMIWTRVGAGARQVELQYRAAVGPDGEIFDQQQHRTGHLKGTGTQEQDARGTLHWNRSQAWAQQLVSSSRNSQFLGKFTIGSEKKELSLILDTGSIFVWVKSDLCNETGCTEKNTFNHSESKSFAGTLMDLNVTFGTGSLSGQIGNDTLCVTLTEQKSLCAETPVALIAEMSGADFDDTSIHGILGLALPNMMPQTARRTYGSPWMKNIIDSKELANNTVSFYLKKSSSEGVVYWGPPPKDIINGTMHKFPVVSEKYYAMKLTSFYIGRCCISLATGNSCDGTEAFQDKCLGTDINDDVEGQGAELQDAEYEQAPQYVIADTGTTYNTLPPNAFAAMSRLGLLKNSTDCDKVPDTNYTFPNIKYCIEKDRDNEDHVTKNRDTKDRNTKDRDTEDRDIDDHGAEDHGIDDHDTEDRDTKEHGKDRSFECITMTPDDYLVEHVTHSGDDKDGRSVESKVCTAAFMKIDIKPLKHSALIGQIFIRSFVTSFEAVRSGADSYDYYVGIGRAKHHLMSPGS